MNRLFLLLTLQLLAVLAMPSVFAKQHIATPYSERVFVTQTTKEFVQQANQELGLDIVFHAGESLYKHNEIYRAVRTNQIQLGEIFIAKLSNHSAIFQLDNLPFLASDFNQAKALWAQQQKEIKAQLSKDNLHLLFANPWPPQGLFTNNKINTIGDLKGLKVRSYSAITARLASHLQMIPTSVSTAEIAQAFATGMIDAMITSPSTGVSSRSWQFSQYYTPVNAWIPKNMVVINKSAFEQLPLDQQEQLKQLSLRFQTLAWDRAQQQTKLMTNRLKQEGMKISPVSTELAHALFKTGEKMAEEWQQLATESEQGILRDYTDQIKQKDIRKEQAHAL